MAVGAQVAFAAVEGTAGPFQHHWLFTSRQGEVGSCVSGVDVVAGAAIERRDVRHALNRRVMRGQAGVDTRLGALSAVTAGAVGTFASYEGLAGPMNRTLSELRFLGPDQGGVIVTFRAGQIRSHDLCNRTGRTSRTSLASRTSRPGRTSLASRTSRASRARRASLASRTGTGSEYQYRRHNQDY
ncbi:MAG TPA: hypothetical protein VI451_21880 [Anaerolineales bacterium]|nr:hypothetical protein [Anaerolineales bacterium]